MDYREREELKRDCYKAMLATDDPRKRALLLVNGLITAHYWRARETIEDNPGTKTKLRRIRGGEYYPGYELEIDHYIENWLWANGDCQNKEDIKEIENVFGYKAKKNKYMPAGHTYYMFGGKV